MKLRSLCLFWMVGVLLGLTAALPSRAELVLRTASPPQAPRYIATTENGKKSIGGLCIDIMRAIESVDPEIRFSGDQEAMPQTRLLSLLELGEVDVAFCFNSNPAREKMFRVIEPPLYEIQYKVAARSNDGIEVRSFDDIRKLGQQGVVLVNFGSASVQFLQSIGGLQIDSSGVTQEINLRKLANGRGRFYYRHELGMQAELEASNLTREIKILPAMLHREEQYVLFSRYADPLAVERVQKALEKLKASGILAKLRAKY